MAYQIRLLDDFFKRLRMEEDPEKPTKITWLIGSGVSVSASIPLAIGISDRIVLFEYLAEISERPWDSNNELPITYNKKDLKDFFIWYSNSESMRSENLEELKKASLIWLKKIPRFAEVSTKNPECYQLLFDYFFQNSKVHHRFLTTLISLVDGVNLAHLALAGILRDHSKWGDTVFTTNFDDLLLKALLSINHTARIFGEVQSKDTPSLIPNYPQIIHLHGRHTGYRLLNTKEQIDLVDPNLHEGFKNQIADSHLLVLGYSGWDDLVMKTLSEWKNQESLLGGSLFWVPFKSEENLIPEIRSFLNNLPPNRVYIIENKNKNLNADSFLLNFCEFLNKNNGGFQPYRQGILDYASNQHSFILEQLQDYPKFNPNMALEFVKEARESFREGDENKAVKLIVKAKKIITAEDIEDKLKAKTLQQIGIIKLLMNKYDEAKNYLEESKLLWEKLSPNSDKAKLEKATTQRALAEIYILRNEFEEARKLLGNNIFIYTSKVEEPKGLGLTYLLFVNLSLREGKTNKATWDLKKSISYFDSNTNPRIFAQHSFLTGKNFLLQNKIDSAKKFIKIAQKQFEEIGDLKGVNICRNYIADILIKNNYLDKSKIIISELIKYFESTNDKLNLANVLNTKGDLEFQSRNFEKAEYYFNKSKDLYQDFKTKYGYANCLADLYKVYLETNSQQIEELKIEIDSIIPSISNPYLNDTIKSNN